MADDNKRKDEIEENINQDNQGDIHEADDTFGLPDIDYDPVTPDEPQEEAPAEPETKEEESAAEPEKEDVDQPYMYASRVEDEPEEPVSEESSSDDDWSSSRSEDLSEADDSESLYHSTETESESDAGTDYSASMEEEESEEEVKSAYVPGSYSSRQENSSNNAGIVIGVLLVLALIAVGAWYFMSYRPAQQEEAEQLARQEQQDAQRAQEEVATRQAEAERVAAEEEAARQAAAEAEEEVVPETGTIETISARTGRYYVVVASAVDGDLAMDYANELSQAGKNVKIIAPYGSVIFHRVAISDLASWDEAQKMADDMKAEYGDGVWVKKY